MPQRPKALLFDLGGVLVDVRFANAIEAWSRHSRLPIDELRARFAYDEPYDRHERGELAAHEYFAHLARTLELDASVEDIESGWNAIFVGEIETTRIRVERARKKLPCFAFTNTNASHTATWSRLYPDVVAAFDRIFTSHQLGLRKPERQAFARICELTSIAAQNIVFFDDVPQYVDAAVAAGLQGVLVRSPADVARALDDFAL